MPFGRKSFFQIGAGDQVYHVRTDQPVVQVYSLDGRRIRTLSVPAERISVTSADLANLRRSYVEYIGPQASELVFGRIQRAYESGQLPKFKPFFKDFVLESSGRIWLRLRSEERRVGKEDRARGSRSGH